MLALGSAAALILSMPVAAGADEGEDDEGDVRVEQTCSLQSRLRLRIRTRDEDRLRVDVDVRTARHGARWAVVVVHERRLVRRVSRRTGTSSGSFSLRLTIADWPGRDTVTVRALGPRGEVCRASATIAEA